MGPDCLICFAARCVKSLSREGIHNLQQILSQHFFSALSVLHQWSMFPISLLFFSLNNTAACLKMNVHDLGSGVSKLSCFLHMFWKLLVIIVKYFTVK